jgi:hypothetical protein
MKKCPDCKRYAKAEFCFECAMKAINERNDLSLLLTQIGSIIHAAKNDKEKIKSLEPLLKERI